MLKVKKNRLSMFFSLGRQDGFTLIELIVASALSLIVMTGIYSVYRSQQKSYIVREQVTVMQQNLRAGMVVMTSDVRMAGYVHPFITPTSTPGISSTSTGEFLEFTLLKNKDDDPDPTDPTNSDLETISYSVNTNKELIRTVDGSSNPQIIAEKIDALNFVYLDIDGNVTANFADVKSIQVTMVARTGRGDRDYLDARLNPNYKNQQGTIIYSPAPDDNNRRRKLSREIRCRNL